MKFFNFAWVTCLFASLCLPTILSANDCSTATNVNLGSCQTISFDATCDFGPSALIPCTALPCQGDAWFEFSPGGTNALQYNVQFDISVNVSNTINVLILYSESKELGDPCEWASLTQGYTVYSFICNQVVTPGVPIDVTMDGMDGSGTFFVLVEQVTTNGGDVTVCATQLGTCNAPSNDRCTNPISLSSGNGIDPNAALGPGIPSWNDALKGSTSCATKQRLTDFCGTFSAGDPTEDHYTRKFGTVCLQNGNLGDAPLIPFGSQCATYLENTVYYTFQVPVTASDWFLHVGSSSQCSQEPNAMTVMLFSNIDCTDSRNATLIACNNVSVFGGIPSADWSYPSSGSGMTLTAGLTYWIVIDGTRNSQCDFCVLLGRGPANPVLPVEFISFDGTEEPTGTLLEWETIVEDGISQFEIERSVDTEHFQQIGTVISEGGTLLGANYSFLDESVPVGGAYYRIRTLDLNGIESYSEVIYVARSLEEAQLFRLYPNPADDQLYVFLGIPNQTQASFTLLDTWGRVVHQETHQLDPGNQERILPVSRFARGLYVLRVQIGNQTFLQKILLN